MTQSKKPDVESTINISELGLENIMEDDTITIDLNNTYGTTTTYWAGDSITDVVYSGSNDGTFTIDINDLTTDTIDIGDWKLSGDFGAISINPYEVEKMCKEYPALEKVWRNFKAVYDMVQQDYEGKKKAGEIDDDDIPF
jgi:UDP-galactopyranose mutase